MISIIKGTDCSIAVTFTEDSTPVDITGYSILFTVKQECKLSEDDVDASISKTITSHSDPTHGKSSISLTNEDTDLDPGYYYWDIRLIKDGIITQTRSDRLEIVQGVTTRELEDDSE